MSFNVGPYPFGPAPGNSNQAYLTFDLQINKVDPGVLLYPTEPNGAVSVFREVNGAMWWVINADFNTLTQQWEQDFPCNASLPAFGVFQDRDGNFVRVVAAETIVPGDPVVWVTVNAIAPDGSVTVSPQTYTAQGAIVQKLVATWNAGTSAAMGAREVDITDTSSSSSSTLDDLKVNGTPVWTVDKTGTLTVGIIPFARITGVPPPDFNNVTLTGTTTMTGDLHVEGNTQLDGTLGVNGAATLHNGLTVSGGIGTDNLNVTGNESVGGNLHVVGNEQVDGNLNVNGTTTLNTLDVTGSASLPSSAVPVTSITGSNGIAVTNTGTTWNVDGGAYVESVTSPDGTVSIGGTPQNPTVEVHSTPLVPGAWFINTAHFAPGSTSGSISLGPLPGTASQSYKIVCWGMLQFHDASHTLTLTGVSAAGVSWDFSPQGYENSQSGSFPFMFFGNAIGGTTPTINWSSDDAVDFTPMFMTIAAGIQL